MTASDLVLGLLVAAARLYLYEFNGPAANMGSTRWTWEAYHLAMQVAYDDDGHVRGSDKDACDVPVGKVLFH